MKLRERILGSVGDFVIRHNKIVLIIGLALAAVSAYFANNIKLNTEMKDLLSAGNRRVLEYDKMADSFGGTSLLLTLEGGSKERMAAAAEDLAARIQADPKINPHIRAVNLKLDSDFVLDKGLLLQKPSDARRMRKLFDKTSVLPFVAGLNESLESMYTGDEAEEDLETSRQELDAVSSMAQIGNFAQALTAVVEAPAGADPAKAAESLADAVVFGDRYSYSQDGSMLLFSVTMNFNMSPQLDLCYVIVDEVKSIIASIRGEYPEIDFAYTGDVGIEADENAAMSSDMLVPSILAYAAILVLFAFSFRQLRSIVFAMLCLALGILFNFGIIGSTLGELNLITSIIMSLLIGMGIDYGIQVTTSYQAFRDEGETHKSALRLTFRRSGFGVILAAATTSASFFVLVSCASKAMRQLGFVAGAGILTCLAAMLFILPALIAWLGRRGASRSRMPQIDYGFLERMGSFAARRRAPVLAVSLVAVLILGFFVSKLGVEYNMMELEPQNVTSIKAYRKIMDKFEMNSNSSLIVTADIEEARALTTRLEKLGSVSEVQSVSAYLPSMAEQEERLAAIAALRANPARPSAMKYGAAEIEALVEEAQRLEWNLIELGDISVAGLGEGNRIVRKRNAMIREIFGAEVGKEGQEVFQQLISALKSDPERAAARLTAIDASFSAKAAAYFARMTAVDRPMTASDLPPMIKDNFLDKKGQGTLITIFPKASATATSEGLRRYDAALRQIAPALTGVTPIMLDLFDEILAESKRAAAYVGALVLLFAFLSFRSVKHTLIAAIPPVLSLVLLFGTLPLLGWKINAMNLATLPLIIGIGVAYGTYMLQRYLVEGRSLGAALKYTSKAIFLSAFTTMVGFGSLWLAGSFKMIASFGAVLFIGIGYCYLTTMLIIPALLGGSKAAAVQAELEERSAS